LLQATGPVTNLSITKADNMNTTNTLSYNQAAEMIYSNEFKNDYIRWLFCTKKKTARTFQRKYQDQEDWHEDMAWFCVDHLPKLLEQLNNPEHDLSLELGKRSFFFTIFHRTCIDRFRKYVTILNNELGEDMIPETTSEFNLTEALRYRDLWNKYIDSDISDRRKVIALSMLKGYGASSAEAVCKSEGISRSTYFREVEKVKAEIIAMDKSDV
jgi:hypothetical protein